MPAEYSRLPAYSQWLRDSSVLVGIRNQDPVLKRIDNLVDALNRNVSNGESLYLYGELFFATNYWLRNFKNNSLMKGGREGAVRSLFAFAAGKLAFGFECSVATLPNKLEEYYGKSMSAHGIRQDSEVLGSRHYMDRAVANQFKIIFKQGIAYQSEWRKPNPKMLRVNSAHWYGVTIDAGKVLQADFAHYVMSMSRDIYMGPHMRVSGRAAGQVAMVHSSWLAGTPVQCAGSMLIENGTVKAIQNNSGHYQPTDSHLVNVLELLRTVGVKIESVDVWDYRGRVSLPGSEFLAERGNWDSILKRRGVRVQQPVTTQKGPAPPPRLGGSKAKKKYRCTSCSRIYEAAYTVTFCQYCKSVCRPA